MSTNNMTKCRQCRAENTKLFLKGDRCLTSKCPLVQKKKAISSKGRKGKVSYYGLQLREKQKLKRFYGVSESQFRKSYDIAAHAQGNTGDTMVQYLERRLDNVIYRLGFAVSRAQARQMVSHAFFQVNGVTCNIPSFIVKKGDTIVLREAKRAYVVLEGNSQRDYTIPQWLEKKDNYQAVILDIPVREDMRDIEVKEQLIIELYSK